MPYEDDETSSYGEDDERAQQTEAPRKRRTKTAHLLLPTAKLTPQELVDVVAAHYVKEAQKGQLVKVTLIDPVSLYYRVNFWEGAAGCGRVANSLVCKLTAGTKPNDYSFNEVPT